MMKKITLFLLCACFAITSLYAQQGPRERIKALKVEFITEKLDLSSSEAEKFWPVYNAHEKKMHQYRNGIREVKKRLRRQSIENLSEAEAQKMLDQIAKVEENIHLGQKQLVKDLKKVFSAKKILLLKKAEDDFNRQLLERFKKKRQERFNRN